MTEDEPVRVVFPQDDDRSARIPIRVRRARSQGTLVTTRCIVVHFHGGHASYGVLGQLNRADCLGMLRHSIRMVSRAQRSRTGRSPPRHHGQSVCHPARPSDTTAVRVSCHGFPFCVTHVCHRSARRSSRPPPTSTSRRQRSQSHVGVLARSILPELRSARNRQRSSVPYSRCTDSCAAGSYSAAVRNRSMISPRYNAGQKRVPGSSPLACQVVARRGLSA